MVDCEICDDGGCSVCFKTESDEPQFASMKEIEEFYNINMESMHMDPAEMDLEDMVQDMIDSEIDFDKEFDPNAE